MSSDEAQQSEEGQPGEQGEGFLPWNPASMLPNVSDTEVKYSKGFSRCKPDAWFPGFSAHWLPLLHSLDLQVELVDAAPVLELKGAASQVFIGSLDDELLSLMVPNDAFEFISRVYVPEASLTAKHLVVEYFARRFLTSLVHSWSANVDGTFRFEQEMSIEPSRFRGGVRLVFRISGEEFSLTIGLSNGLLDRFDQLWVSQIAQGAGGAVGSMPVKLILGGSYISPSEIGEIISPGKNIPITFGGFQESYLFLHDEPWMRGELCSLEGAPAFRILGESDERFSGPTGTTQVLFEAGAFEVSRVDMMLLSQPQAISLLPETAGLIQIVIGGQKVGEGNLVTYDSQLFVQVASKSA